MPSHGNVLCGFWTDFNASTDPQQVALKLNELQIF